MDSTSDQKANNVPKGIITITITSDGMSYIHKLSHLVDSTTSIVIDDDGFPDLQPSLLSLDDLVDLDSHYSMINTVITPSYTVHPLAQNPISLLSIKEALSRPPSNKVTIVATNDESTDTITLIVDESKTLVLSGVTINGILEILMTLDDESKADYISSIGMPLDTPYLYAVIVGAYAYISLYATGKFMIGEEEIVPPFTQKELSVDHLLDHECMIYLDIFTKLVYQHSIGFMSTWMRIANEFSARCMTNKDGSFFESVCQSFIAPIITIISVIGRQNKICKCTQNLSIPTTSTLTEQVTVLSKQNTDLMETFKVLQDRIEILEAGK